MAMHSTANAPIEKDTINSVISDLWRDAERIRKLGDQIDALGDLLIGSRPTPIGSSQADEPPASSVLDNLTKLRRSMRDMLSRCEDLTQRMDGGIRNFS